MNGHSQIGQTSHTGLYDVLHSFGALGPICPDRLTRRFFSQFAGEISKPHPSRANGLYLFIGSLPTSGEGRATARKVINTMGEFVGVRLKVPLAFPECRQMRPAGLRKCGKLAGLRSPRWSAESSH
jgi:hypothetical protein